MAKADSEATTVAEAATEETEFAVTLEEFLSEIPKTLVETKTGFAHTCNVEQIKGKKMRSEWAALFELYKTQPVSVSWGDWVKQGGK